ncbi:sigma-54-dependent Fis family transcriptional regulator [Paenibacillus abyssi]|uniref:sigma-54-dependent Fis family transcriptional regulator n=1 Tax=Paenibacillus abyssi TaxID=1340531 RepID=UPI0027E40344|nr:sigma-54-dependent Fis family transcriptional regulator [Paenibacillus abyssi]
MSLEHTNLTNVMAQSWKRCHDFGLSPSDPVEDHILTGNRIQEVLKHNKHIVNYAEQVFEKMKDSITQSGQVALLIDARGTIIHAVGDPGFSRRAEIVQLQVGANWEEKRKGTNAIGVALMEKIPVRVHAQEHYFSSNHFLTCASSPVFDSTGQLLGVINISGKQEHYHPHTLSLACMAADSLQNKIIMEESNREHLITLKELEYTAHTNPLPLISLDRDNRIIRANQAAIRIVGKDAIGKEFIPVEGFAVETIHDHHHKVWRSVAVQNKKLSEAERRLYTFDDIAGSCPTLMQKKELAQRAALTDYPVLLLGESGTGKELFAQSIHTASARFAEPFIALNCSAIPESLVESELFGYERGAFTGASKDGSTGKFEAAHRGTLFLDEIGDMPLRAQAALLRVLQEGIITPVGSTKNKPIEVRVVAATNKNLLEEIKAGRFRADLYYRLKGIQITLPSLRDRSDIMLLVGKLLHKQNIAFPVITERAQEKLRRYSWPGNIRELNSVLVQASFLAEGEPIGPEHLLIEEEGESPLTEDKGGTIPSLKEAEVFAIKKALQSTEWNLSKAAALLKIGRTTLYRKIEEYGITVF